MSQDAIQVAERLARIEKLLGIGPLQTDAQIDDAEGGSVSYQGGGPWSGGTVAWRQDRSWADVMRVDPDSAAAVCAALASSMRLEVVLALLSSPLSTAALGERLGGPSAGQLHHHLRDLLAAGVVDQPQRGMYAIRHQHVVPLLVLLSACQDLAGVSP